MGQNSRNNRTVLFQAHVLMPLGMGLVIYLRLRPRAIISKQIFRLIPALTKLAVSGRHTVFQQIAGNFIPDACWAYALTVVVSVVLDGQRGMKHLNFAVSAVFCTVMECLQFTGTLPGTFDPLDVLVEVAACGIAVIVISVLGEDYK